LRIRMDPAHICCSSEARKPLAGRPFFGRVSITFAAQSLGTKYVLDAAALERIRAILGGGGLVVHPTDTVYGLAADPFQAKAIDRLYAVKGRPRDEPVSMAVSSVAEIFRFAERSPLAEAFCSKNLPGPFTVVLRAGRAAPPSLVSKEGRIAFRIPDHPISRLLSKAYGPITSTSANRHGEPSPVTCEEARAQLGDDVDVYLDGGPTRLGGESTVIDVSGPQARILRQGVRAGA
ncbi:MAG: threonylcarbamoyl-AMP synthase, partial [Thermoplasmata archaeon]|nr:threonylcarbamoyl-AMP synthase [Thermoplasmata archaeon]